MFSRFVLAAFNTESQTPSLQKTVATISKTSKGTLIF